MYKKEVRLIAQDVMTPPQFKPLPDTVIVDWCDESKQDYLEELAGNKDLKKKFDSCVLVIQCRTTPVEDILAEAKKEYNAKQLKAKLKECFPDREYYALIDGLARAVFCLEHTPGFAGFYGSEEKPAVEKFFALCKYDEND